MRKFIHGFTTALLLCSLGLNVYMFKHWPEDQGYTFEQRQALAAMSDLAGKED